MGYTIQVDEEKSYVLGLQQLVSKSASDTLESLKVILSDIDDGYVKPTLIVLIMLIQV